MGKRIITTLLLIFWGCCVFSCEDLVHVGWSASVKNNADYPIVFVYSFKVLDGKYYPSTGWPENSQRIYVKPNGGCNSMDINPSSKVRDTPEDSISLFIFHPDTLAKYSWEEIKVGKMYLKKYNLKMKDFGYRTEGSIIYP